MKHHQPSGINHGIRLWIDSDWTPEQALAVFELLDDLRDVICSRYDLRIQKQYRDQRRTEGSMSDESTDNDPEVPF